MSIGKNLKGIIDRDGVKHAVPAGGGGVDPSIIERLAGKTDKVDPSLEGHLAAYDEEGNLIDGGAKSQFAAGNHGHIKIKTASGREAHVECGNTTEAGGKIDLFVEDENGENRSAIIDYDNMPNLNRALLSPDTIPTSASDKLITSGAVYTALNGKAPYYNGQVIIKHKDDTIAYPVAGDDEVKNSLLALYNAIPDSTYVLCRVVLDNSDYSGTPSDIVTVPALAYAETGDLQDEWDVSILLANGVTFTASQQGTITRFWSKKTSGFFS